MSNVLSNKIDFMLIISATNANPNGDPLNGNRPRENYDGYGEISDVCIKRKIRNRLQDMGEKIFVQSDERCDDGFKSLSERAKELSKIKDKEEYTKKACEKWIDVRSFGQVFAFKDNSVSVGVRGPVSIHQSVSVNPVDIVSMQITKSVNSEPNEKGKSSDTMGTKHFISFGLYIVKGSINCQLAEKTGFSDDDAGKIKEALKTLFDNDSSAARPDGSMEVCKFLWCKHNNPNGQYSSAKVHRSVKIEALTENPKTFSDYKITIEKLADLNYEEIL
ncbi:MAG: type I-C CRISPR-associated protein Cas7/Csd2 [Endomicrobiaceae bacterium]|jgi:CRISPR-associated protein Csd2|nr:type I-C CRISPR-associated protein Cas7/Csd2 [Endomicrobiaceae bacterium]